MAARRFFRVIIFIILAAYIVAGLAFAALKFWLLPSIDRWNEPLSQSLSQALGVPVHIGQISAKWQGALPELELKDVAVYGPQGEEVFTAPYAYGRLKLSSLWHFSPHFARLDLQGITIHLARNEQGHFELFGQAFDPANERDLDESFYFSFYQWLGQQGRLQISQSQLRFTDQLKSADTLALDVLALSLQQHQGELHASGALASLRHTRTKVHFQSQWQLPTINEQQATDVEALLDGQLWLQVEELQPSAWRDWVDIPSFLYQGTITAHLFAQVQNQQLEQLQGDVIVDRPFWADGRQFLTTEPQPFFQAQSAQFHFELSNQALEVLSKLHRDDPLPTYVPGSLWRMQAEDLYVHIPQEFESPLFFKEVGFHFHSQMAGSEELWAIEQAHLDAGSGQLQFSGTLSIDDEDLWQTSVDVQGTGRQIQLNSIYQYFPESLDPDLRDWLSEGLTAGEISSLRFEWSGLLDDFEYYQERSQGGFRLQAELIDAVVDYFPADEQDKGWPAIVGLDAWLQWENNGLHITAQNEAALRMNEEDAQVALTHLEAEITDLYERADLTVRGHSKGAAKDYYYLWSHWDLAEVLEDTVEVTQLSGYIEVPLLLSIPVGLPLEEMEELIEVQGEVHFGKDVQLQLWPELPPFNSLNGVLGFSDSGARLTGVTGQWLGGTFQADGALGAVNERLELQAQVQAQDLVEFYKHPSLQALEGAFALDIVIFLDEQEHIHLLAESSLQGLQLRLPEPLQKSLEATQPLNVYWRGLDPAAQRNYLQITLGNDLIAETVFSVQAEQVESFNLRSGNEPTTLEEGLLWVDIGYPRLDLDAWWDWYEQVDEQTERTNWQWPERSKLRIKADEAHVLGFGLQYLTYTHQFAAPDSWRADISSDQIAGTIFWHPPAQAHLGAGHIDAYFQRFDVLAQFMLDEELVLVPEISEAETQKKDSLVSHTDTPKRGAASLVLAKEGVITEQEMHATKEQALSALPQEALAAPFEQLPTITLGVDKFKVRGYLLGQLTLDALALPEARGWEISKFELTAPELMHTQGKGRWQLWGATPGLSLQWESDISELGGYARYVGLEELIDGGQGRLSAQFDWPYLPWRSNLYFLSGQAELDWQDGRLEPVKSRSAKLLELLSLQSLARIARLDLDIGSVLKDGFPFHAITGSIALDKGWATTSDYQVLSPVGTLLFEGRTNIQTQAIDAQALVIPEVDVSGAALAAGMVVNPVVGFGALIAQWLLKHPLSAAMTVQYQLSGDWDDFVIEEIPLVSDQEITVPPTEAH